MRLRAASRDYSRNQPLLPTNGKRFCRWKSKPLLSYRIQMAILVSLVPAKAPSLYPTQARLLRDLGARLREARLRRRLTVMQVAERADVSRPTLNKVEQGDAAVTMGTYLRVLAVLGLDKDLALLAAQDPVGRRLQDAELGVPRRAPKRKSPPEDGLVSLHVAPTQASADSGVAPSSDDSSGEPS